MIEQRLPFAEVELPCKVCGRMVLQLKRRQGRHARFCSVECKHNEKRVWDARWRAKYPHWRDWYRRRKAGGGSKVHEASVAEPVSPSRADFFPVASNFQHADDGRF
jgi:hypothetical protein